MDVKITEEKFVDIMDKLIEYKNILDNFSSSLEDSGFLRLADDNELDAGFCELLDSFARMLGLLEDENFGNDLSWYIFETDCGREINTVMVNGVEYSIRTVEDLYKLISGEFNGVAAEN